jgi:hypothetical protein
MSQEFLSKLGSLRKNYAQVTGKPFAHFLCPILYLDEETELCQGHIINQAFANAPRVWTVQRKDVDGFYGSRFEADYMDIQYMGAGPQEIVADKHLSRRFNATLYSDGQPVELFASRTPIPEKFTPIEIDGSNAVFGIKMHPTDFMESAEKRWEIEVRRDIRLPALVTALKAAHLTMFHLLGYPYALSAAGQFIGRQILGEFFLQNHELSRAEVMQNAAEFFLEFSNMVRPMESPQNILGSLIDRRFFICMGSSGNPWGVIVLVKTLEHVQGVLLPGSHKPDQVATYFDFLKNDTTSIQAANCSFENDKWEISKKRDELKWPKPAALCD